MGYRLGRVRMALFLLDLPFALFDQFYVELFNFPREYIEESESGSGNPEPTMSGWSQETLLPKAPAVFLGDLMDPEIVHAVRSLSLGSLHKLCELCLALDYHSRRIISREMWLRRC